jgi:CheY-like chemotaxis protein
MERVSLIESSVPSKFDVISDEPSELLGSDNCGCTSTVLLADDNPFNLIPLKCILEENYDIACDLVENGVEEVNAFIKNYEKQCCDVRYKLILTDLNMPEMDGFDAARNIFAYY